MKKFLSMMLTTILVISMSTVAFAANVDNSNGNDASATDNTVVIKKEYTATGDTAKSPAEIFKFVIKAGEVLDGGVDADGEVITQAPDATIGTVTYSEGQAGSENAVQEIVVKLPSYEAVGIYYYTITETAGDTAGVTYFDDVITLIVTVTQNEKGQLVFAAVHCESPVSSSYEEGSTKTDTFTNNYAAGTLEVSKTVTGNMGDTSKYWKFEVTFTAPQDAEGNYLTVGAPITINTDELSEGNLTTMTAWKNGKATATVYVKDGETISFENIPYGVSYEVVEEEANKDGYTTTVSEVDADGKKTPVIEANGVINVDGPDDVFAFTNSKTKEVDTGITLDSAPYMMMLIIAAAGIAFFLTKKRRYTED